MYLRHPHYLQGLGKQCADFIFLKPRTDEDWYLCHAPSMNQLDRGVRQEIVVDSDRPLKRQALPYTRQLP